VAVLTSTVSVVLLLPLHGAFLVIVLGIVLVKLFALIDAASRPAGAFTYHDKKTKQFWIVVLALALASTFAGFLSIIGLVAALVYLVDVRPAIVSG
jgi:hypothetical protein